MADDKRIRVNALAQELGIDAKTITDLQIPGLEKKSIVSQLTESEEALVRAHFFRTTDIQRVLISFDRKFRVLGKQMSEIHQTQSMSEYIRGLIVLDALVSVGEVKVMSERDIPSWLLSEYPLPLIRKFREEYISNKSTKKSGLSL